jgi:hypothetical protein
MEQSQQQVIRCYEGNLACYLGMIATLDAEVKTLRNRGQFYMDMQTILLNDGDAMSEWRALLTLLRLSGPDRPTR